MLLKKEFLKLNQKQKTEIVDNLIEKSTPSYNFFLMLFLSIVITALGLLINSPAIVIGGMLVAPILSPMLAFSMGIIIADFRLIKRSALLIIEIIIFTLVVSFFIASVVFHRELNSEILTRISPNLIYFFIALVAGAAGSYAFAKPKLSEALPGVAISVAVLPPLVVSGIGISFLSWRLIVGSFGLFFINVIGVIFASVIIFSLLGFYEQKKYISEKIIKEEKIMEKEKAVHTKGEIKEVAKKLEEVKEILTDRNNKNKKQEK